MISLVFKIGSLGRMNAPQHVHSYANGIIATRLTNFHHDVNCLHQLTMFNERPVTYFEVRFPSAANSLELIWRISSGALMRHRKIYL